MNLFQLATSGIDLEALPTSRQPEPVAEPSEPSQAFGRPISVPREIDSIIQEAAAIYGIDPNVVRGVAFAESGFDPDVISGKRRSSAGAVGLMQFMPDTAKELDIDPLNVREAIFGGAYYLRKNLDKFDGDYGRAVAAYNWGPNRNVFQRDDWFATIPKETDDYLKRVFSVADSFGTQAEPERDPRVSLPEGVEPSQAGGGRGSVSPGMVNTKIPRAAVPDMTAGSVARDIASGALQIGPTAVGGVGELLGLVSGGKLGQGVRDFAKRGNEAIQDVVGSERAQAQRQNFAADMADDGVSIGQALMNNKGAMADMALPQLGSMLIPVGVAGAAGKAATVGKTAQALSKGALAARVASVQQAAGIGATAAQNAASTFAELVDKGASLEDAYLAAGITVPFSLVAGKLTGGGAEGALIRSSVSDAVKRGALEVPKAVIREGGQELGEETGQILGEAVGTGKAPTATAVGKQLAVAGVLGGLTGGSMNVATQAMAPRVESQPSTPQAPVAQRQEPTIDVTYQTADGQTVTDVVRGNAPEAQPDTNKAQAVDNIAKAILEAESKSAQPATGIAAELEALRARNASQQTEAAPAAEVVAPAADLETATPETTTTEGAPADAPQPAQSGTETSQAVSAQSEAQGPRVVLQNRDRSTPSSIAQMRSIAAKPDYGRLGFSRDFANGAPVVAGGTIEPTQLGRQDVATASDGRRIPVQYAVVEAANVLPSNRVDGTPNADYGQASVPAVRAIAGNGRIAGLQAAYQGGNAATYRQELAQDAALHGIDPAVISTLKQPVLVRVMPETAVTADIGDVSNSVGNLDLSAVEQANNDANRVSLDALQFAEDGGITPEAVRQFVRAMPQAEQGGLLDTNGQPTKQAVDRLNAAVFAKAYGNDDLVRLFAQAQDPEARNVLSALAQVAPKMARLEGAGALDIREVVAQAAEIAVNARRQGVALARMAEQQDMAADPLVSEVLALFARNARTVRPVVDALGAAADFAYTEATKPAEDMFGAVPRASRADVINTLRPQNERTSQENLEQPAGSGPVQVDAAGQGANARAAPDAERNQAGRTAQDGAALNGQVSEQGAEYSVRQQFSLFGQEQGDQLQLFLDNGPVPSQAGARAVEAQREAVQALADMESTASILAKSLSRDFAARQRVSLVGQKVSTSQDLAVLAQVYRDPRFETFRLVFTDNEGNVVSQLGITSRLPASAEVIVGDDVVGYLREVAAAASKTGATSYYMLHNHPSGQSQPSGADVSLTRTFAQWLPGLTLRSHVVIDTNEYSVITGAGRVQKIQKDFPQMPTALGGAMAGEKITSYSNVVQMAQQLQVDHGAITLIATNNQFAVKAVTTISPSKLTGSKGLIRLKMARALMRMESSNVFAIGRDESHLRKLSGVVVDALHVSDDGQVKSLASNGLIPSKLLGAFPEKRRPRVTADSSQVFNYLRFDPSTMQSAGTRAVREQQEGLTGYTAEEVTQRQEEATQAEATAKRVEDAAARADSKAGNNPPPIPTSAQNGLFNTPPWQLPEATHTDKLIYELQDGRVDLKRVQEAIAATGKTITEGFDARLAETLLPGRVARRTETFLTVEAKPLLESMAKNNVSQDELSDYLLARHAPERNAQVAKVNPDMPDGGAGTNSQGVLMTTQAARDHIAGLTAGKRIALELLARQVDAITAGTRDILVREGLEKQETIDAWMGAYKHYVPLFKDESMDTMAHPMGAGLSVTGSASRRATGSTGEVTNMLAHVLMQRETAITRAEKNRAAMSLYGLALTNPNAEMWTTIRPSMPADQIADELVRMGVDPMDAEVGMQGVPTIRGVDPVSGKVVDRPNPMYKRLDNALTVKVNGEDRVILFNAENERAMRLVRNLKNQDGVLAHLDLAGSFIGKATRYFASINTQYNPAFGMVNVIRDVGGALVNLSDTALAGKQARVLSDSIPAAIGIARDLRGDAQRTPWSDLWQQFQDDGGRTGYRDLFTDPYKRAEAVQSELDKLSKQGTLTPGAAAHAVLDLLDDFNTTLENGVRLSAYKAALDQGLSRAEAARLARELTLDFNRKGRAGRELGPLFAFFNASVQGTARTLKALQGPAGKRILIGGVGLGVMQALMLAAAGFDDDEIPDFVKARALIIPMPGKQYIAIPLQFGLNALPNTGRVATELLMSGGKDWAEKSFNALGELAGSFNPLGGGNIFTGAGLLKTVAPTVVDPIVDMATNTDFTGKPIGKERMPWDTRPGFAMARESTQRAPTGQAYVGISKAINSLSGGNDFARGLASPSPEEVRYVFTTLGGGVYRELEKVLNASLLTAQGETLKAREVPFGSRFAGEVEDADVQRGRYFKNNARLEKLEAQLKGLSKEGRGEELRALVKDNPEIQLYELNNQVSAELAKLNKLAAQSINDRETLKRIDDARTQYMRALNDKVRELERAAK